MLQNTTNELKHCQQSGQYALHGPSFTAIPPNRRPMDPAPGLMARHAPLQKDKHIAAFNAAQGLAASMLRSSFPIQIQAQLP